MPAHSWKLAVFDMAGTTVALNNPVPAAFRIAFERCGVHLNDSEVAAVRGRSKLEAITLLLRAHNKSDYHPQQVLAEFEAALLTALENEGVQSIDGAEATFSALRTNGCAVALSTGFNRPLADYLVMRRAWGNLVDFTVTNSEVAAGRPAPDLIHHAMALAGVKNPEQVVAIGDTTADLEAGCHARVGLNVGVLSGAHSKSRLSKSGPDRLISSVAVLPAVLGLR